MVRRWRGRRLPLHQAPLGVRARSRRRTFRGQIAVDWTRAPEALRAVRRELHLVLKQADYDYRRVQYNTVVSAGMKMLNALESAPADGTPASNELVREGLSLLLALLNPVVPHVTHVLWQDLGYAARHGDIVDAAWPQVDAAAPSRRTRSSWFCRSTASLEGNTLVAAGPTRRRSRPRPSPRRPCSAALD